MVELIPDVLSPDVKSQAEVELFNEFRNTNTNSHFIILHSLALSEHVHNIFGEIDFVIICSRGVLCVEVKGGAVSCSNGIWSFTNRYGKTNTKTEGPFQQVQGNMQSLRQYLMKRLGKRDALVTCQYACCVLIPQCEFTYDGIEIIPEILFDKSSRISLEHIVAKSFDYWERKLQSNYGFSGSGLSSEEMERLANLLRGDFRFVPSMKDIISKTSKELCALTDEQYDILEALSDNERMLVSGGAGTGKTLLAMEQARRAYWTGQNVLYLCFNKNIAAYVRQQFEKENADISAQHLHAILMDNVTEVAETKDENYFENILPEQFIREFSGEQYDYLIVDEGQDLFRPRFMACMDKLLKGGLNCGRWLMFYDHNQNIYNSDYEIDDQLGQLKKSGASFRLSVNCRNTKQIIEANGLMTGIKNTGRAKVEGLNVKYLPYNNHDEAMRILNDILVTLRNDGVNGNDLIILSKYGITNPMNTLYGHTISVNAGMLKTSGNIWQAKKNEIRFSTVSSFKGLEAKVVILIDVDRFSDQTARMLNYVAISRASSLLYVLYDSSREQERQNMIVNSFIH